jgi:hypothetical protein
MTEPSTKEPWSEDGSAPSTNHALGTPARTAE